MTEHEQTKADLELLARQATGSNTVTNIVFQSAVSRLLLKVWKDASSEEHMASAEPTTTGECDHSGEAVGSPKFFYCFRCGRYFDKVCYDAAGKAVYQRRPTATEVAEAGNKLIDHLGAQTGTPLDVPVVPGAITVLPKGTTVHKLNQVFEFRAACLSDALGACQAIQRHKDGARLLAVTINDRVGSLAQCGYTVVYENHRELQFAERT